MKVRIKMNDGTHQEMEDRYARILVLARRATYVVAEQVEPVQERAIETGDYNTRQIIRAPVNKDRGGRNHRNRD